MKRKRVRARKSIKEIAEAMGFCPSYVCELEHGNRKWTGELVDKYTAACS
jgi:transcriptional regulator with XRE-family HTH domain